MWMLLGASAVIGLTDMNNLQRRLQWTVVDWLGGSGGGGGWRFSARAQQSLEITCCGSVIHFSYRLGGRGLVAHDVNATNPSPLFKRQRSLDAGNIHVVCCHGA